MNFNLKEEKFNNNKQIINSKLSSIKIKEFEDISKRLKKLKHLKEKSENIALN